MRDLVSDPRAVIARYSDGMRGTVLMLDEVVNRGWAYAARTGEGVVSTEFVLSRGPIFAHFSYLSLNIEEFFLTGRTQAPVERTYLTSAMMDMGIRSIVKENGRELPTPFLENVRYDVEGIVPVRPTQPRPTGDSIGDWPPEGYDFIIPERFR